LIHGGVLGYRFYMPTARTKLFFISVACFEFILSTLL
jgi:hypothetical protein